MKANKLAKLAHDNNGYTQVIGGIIVLLLLVIVGSYVFYEVADAFEVTDGTDAAHAKENATEMGVTIFSLIVIIALVIVASVIMAIIMKGFTGDKGM